MKNATQILATLCIMLTSTFTTFGQNEITQTTTKIADADSEAFLTTKQLSFTNQQIGNALIIDIEQTPGTRLSHVAIFAPESKKNTHLKDNDLSCVFTWSKTNLGRTRNYRVELKVLFEQKPKGDYTETTCTIGHVKLQKRFLRFFWREATACSITLSGSFSGPRSPVNANGNSGYYYPNPFSINYSSPIIHYQDESVHTASCYTMTHAAYTITASFADGGSASASVGW